MPQPPDPFDPAGFSTSGHALSRDEAKARIGAGWHALLDELYDEIAAHGEPVWINDVWPKWGELHVELWGSDGRALRSAPGLVAATAPASALAQLAYVRRVWRAGRSRRWVHPVALSRPPPGLSR